MSEVAYTHFGISIHALREEGDQVGQTGLVGDHNFYPRPPRGGRRAGAAPAVRVLRFLSTPSARRATYALDGAPLYFPEFLSTPSARRATFGHHVQELVFGISIHALRKEGDFFLDTPDDIQR